MILLRFAEDRMRRFGEGIDRGQATLFPERLEDWIDGDNPVRVIGWMTKTFGVKNAENSCVSGNLIHRRRGGAQAASPKKELQAVLRARGWSLG
jgi:hypothetical protein